MSVELTTSRDESRDANHYATELPNYLRANVKDIQGHEISTDELSRANVSVSLSELQSPSCKHEKTNKNQPVKMC